MKWIISANGRLYDHASAFDKWGYIDWRQNKTKYKIGDTVYIYCTRPYMKVMYKTRVDKTYIPFSEITDDREFWKEISEYEKSKTGYYVRLRLTHRVDNDHLLLQHLLLHGLSAAPQGPIKAKEQLCSYMDKYFDDFDSQDYFPDLTNPENDPLIEGIAKSVLVNKYERSSIARQRCIEYRGNSCSVCGLNFESIYGELGKGFIHIHHLIPLHEIKAGYVVN